MSKWKKLLGLMLATCLLTSCGVFSRSSKVDGFCSTSAFISTQDYKPTAPVTNKDEEFHKVAGENVSKQHTVIRAYDSLRECWDYWIEEKRK